MPAPATEDEDLSDSDKEAAGRKPVVSVKTDSVKVKVRNMSAPVTENEDLSDSDKEAAGRKQSVAAKGSDKEAAGRKQSVVAEGNDKDKDARSGKRKQAVSAEGSYKDKGRNMPAPATEDEDLSDSDKEEGGRSARALKRSANPSSKEHAKKRKT